ncbi:hypothetical protein [Bifidobacterium stellenboschense]|nr:hypothetical protein [Bifidobacterium stellenboschense]
MVDSTDTPAALAGEREDIDIDAWADRIREEDGVRAGGSAVPTSRMR